MKVFEAFFKMVKANYIMIIIYLGIFMGISFFLIKNVLDSSSTSLDVKLDVAIVDNDSANGESDLIAAMKAYEIDLLNFKDIAPDKIDDALFYNDVSIIIYIPEGFSEGFLAGDDVKIDFKKNSESAAVYLAQSEINDFFKLSKVYLDAGLTDTENLSTYMLNQKQSLSNYYESEIISSDSTTSGTTLFFNQMGYVIPALLITLIGTVMLAFRPLDIKRRMDIASISQTKTNAILMLCNYILGLAIIVVLFLLGKVIYPKIEFSYEALYYLNAFSFMIAMVAMAYLLVLLFRSKEATIAISVVASLGCAFLTGVFVPQQYMDQGVLAFAHILPQYWFVSANEMLADIGTLSFENLKPFYFSILMQFIFTSIFVIATIIIANKRRTAEQ